MSARIARSAAESSVVDGLVLGLGAAHDGAAHVVLHDLARPGVRVAPVDGARRRRVDPVAARRVQVVEGHRVPVVVELVE